MANGIDKHNQSGADPRIGKYVVHKNGIFTGTVERIVRAADETEMFIVKGYSVLTGRGLIPDVKPSEVIAVFVDDEKLFS